MIVLTGRSANWAGMSANRLPANFQRQLQRPSWLGLDEMSVLPSTAEIISHSDHVGSVRNGDVAAHSQRKGRLSRRPLLGLTFDSVPSGHCYQSQNPAN
jgi:hypothetical protein